MTFPSKLLLFRFFFMLPISLKDDPKLNAAVNSSPSSWGKTWITMTQQSSTALSMERTSSSVWRTSGRPGKHQKVKKGKEPTKESFPRSGRVWVAGALGRVCSSQEGCAAFPPLYQALCSPAPFLRCGFPGFPQGCSFQALPAAPERGHQRISSCFVPLPRNVCKIQPNSSFLKHPVPDGAVMGW